MLKRGSRIRGMAPDEAAAYWLIRQEEGVLSQRDQADFEQWYSAVAANANAFDRARTMWTIFEDADGDPNLDAIRESALATGSGKARAGRWIFAGGAIAATLLLSLALNDPTLSGKIRYSAQTLSGMGARDSQTVSLDRRRFSTAKGEKRAVELNDGTVLTLNTDSIVEVTYTPGQRLVRLLRGQVLFEVAKDHRRPFVVQAADRQVTALGTVFEIRLDRDKMKIVLVEGKVVVDALSENPANAALMVPIVMKPGEEFLANTGATAHLAKVDVDQQLRWRQGFVEFDDIPLTSAIEEMNRYSERQLVIADADIGKLRVSGVFRTGNPERFAAILGELLPVHSNALTGDRIELDRAKDGRFPRHDF